MLNTIEIEENLETLVADVATGSCALHDFPFRLMEAYSASRNEITKLRMKHPAGLVVADMVWPKKLLYRPADRGQVQSTIEALKALLIGKNGKVAKSVPRFLMSTDGDEFLAVDLKSGETPGFDRLADLPVNYDFLLPMFGVERYQPAPETVADVRAARHMAKFHDAIRDANPDWGDDRVHDLNLFMTRLLFCMFAEDTGIFTDNLFLETLRREAVDIGGSDTKRVIEDIFLALDIADKSSRREKGVRSQRIAADFPYVNGGLFHDHTEVPSFNRRARRLLLEAAGLHWDQIHADIFGSMIQAIVQTDMRADFGMHYTSVPNIMKVLDPLFLNSLREQLAAAGDNIKALEKLLDRISRIHVFDPACGSGNFLIIAYRQLRIIETEAFKRIRDVKRRGQLALADFQTGIKISNFYGIDPVDFSCETAKLSLWISQYQMNKELDEICLTPTAALPLTDSGNINVGNALRVDWHDICSPEDAGEIYIVGNPPYLGRANQKPNQKKDMIKVFSPITKKFKKLDYVASWFLKSAHYARDSAIPVGVAFVSTNSICQGEQVGLLWPHILKHLDISFAYSSFKWSNNASNKAAVTCVIIGMSSGIKYSKKLITDNSSVYCNKINPYLIDSDTVYISGRNYNLSKLPVMHSGNQPIDGGNLILTYEEKLEIIKKYPESHSFIKKLVGSQEIIKGIDRYCLWVSDERLNEALSIEPIKNRIEKTRDFRLSSNRLETNEQALNSHRFVFIPNEPNDAIALPLLSSERRPYLTPIFVGDDTVVSNLAFAIYNSPTWIFSLLSSRLMFVWTRSVGSQFKTDTRFSNTLVYNTFPAPNFSSNQKEAMEEHALQILRVREPYIVDGKTIAWLYNPETMPADLQQAHRDLDDFLEAVYIGRPFKDDSERLERLFKLYVQMTKSMTKVV